MKKLHEEWFEYARDDLSFAKAGLKDGYFSHVCVLAQQAVEKAMKGHLVFQGKKYPKTHGLLFLLELMDVNWLSDYEGELRKLNEFYVPLRYPDAAGTLPDGPPTQRVAAKAVAWAERIVTLIESKLSAT